MNSIRRSKKTAPVNVTPPIIGGTAEIGQTLVAASDGEWAGNPTPSLSRNWQRNGVDIPGATEAKYMLQAIDCGLTIHLRVRGMNSEGSTDAFSHGLIGSYAPPVVAGSITDQSFPANTGIQAIATAGAFQGTDLTFSLVSAPVGLIIDRVTGVISIDTSATGRVEVTRVLVRVTNNGGSAEAEFDLSVVDSPMVLLWADEFDAPLDMTTASHVGDWRPNDHWQDINKGYEDFAGKSWNINPNQHPAHSPFSVADSVLRVRVKRTPPDIIPDIEAALGAGKAPEWSGGILVSNRLKRTFKFGRIECRARMPYPGKGAFPALWLFQYDENVIPSKGRAEIDLMEVFGHATGQPFNSTLHLRDSTGAGRQVNVGGWSVETSGWHVYALDWQPDALRFYRDGTLLAEVTGADAEWFAHPDVRMSFRANFSMNGDFFPFSCLSDVSTPETMVLEVDYVRYYGVPQPAKRAQIWTGHNDVDPTPPPGWNRLRPEGVSASVPLNSPEGASTGWTATVADAFQGYAPNGASTGTESGVAPDKVLMNYAYVSASEDSRGIYRISGLDDAKRYTIRALPSRGGISSRLTSYTIDGETVEVDAANNTQDFAVFQNVAPSGGTISVGVAPGSAGVSFGYINALLIDEQA